MIDIDLRYKIPLVGKYNAIVYECPFCDQNILKELSKHIIGFSDSPIGLVVVIECPKCHEKYYFHCDEYFYYSFLDSVEDGENLHFK